MLEVSTIFDRSAIVRVARKSVKPEQPVLLHDVAHSNKKIGPTRMESTRFHDEHSVAPNEAIKPSEPGRLLPSAEPGLPSQPEPEHQQPERRYHSSSSEPSSRWRLACSS